MLCFVLSLIGGLSKVLSILLAPFLSRSAICWIHLISTLYLVVLSQFVYHQHCVKGSFRLYFGVVKSHNCRRAVMSQFITKFLFLILANVRWDVALPQSATSNPVPFLVDLATFFQIWFRSGCFFLLSI